MRKASSTHTGRRPSSDDTPVRFLSTALALALLAAPALAQQAGLVESGSGLVKGEVKIGAASGGSLPLGDQTGFGNAVDVLGDLDGNGVADLVVGADQTGFLGSKEGAVWIVYLGASGEAVDYREIDAGEVGTGLVPAHSNLGSAVAGLGDVDGDGVPDAAVAASGATGGIPSVLWLFLLNANGSLKSAVEVDLSGLGPLSTFGEGMAALGDANGDGFQELAILDHEFNTGLSAMFVLSVRADGTLAGFVRNDPLPGRELGPLGDIDGDGVQDVGIGSPNEGVREGAMYVTFLRSDGTIREQFRIAEGVGGFDAPLADKDAFGTAVAGAGDVDGDGTPDVLVGASAITGSGLGNVYILSLRSNGSVRWHRRIGDGAGGFGGTVESGQGFGSALTRVGDLDGDGRVEVVIGARGDDGSPAPCGDIFGVCTKGAIWVAGLETGRDAELEGSTTTVRVRNGGGGNPLCLTSASAPRLGAPLELLVETGSSGPSTGGLFVTDAPSEGTLTSFGEILVSGRRLIHVAGAVHGSRRFILDVPDDPALVGRTVHAQAFRVGPQGLTVCNALELELGR